MAETNTIAIQTEYVELVLDSGELVRIEYRVEHMGEFFESIEHCMKRKDWWSPSGFDGCTAEFLGMRLDRVNMARVVGML